MNYVGVRFQSESLQSVASKCYTYRNRCDLQVGDFATVIVSGMYKVVKVVEVSDTLIGVMPENQLKWIHGAVYPDNTQREIDLAKKRIREIEEVAQHQERIMVIRDSLEAKMRAEYNKLQSFVEKNQ